MASLGLIDAYFKTERAKHHLDELKIAISEFAESHAYAITTQDDIEEGLHKIIIRFNDPHVWLHLIAGDVFHCLRSALDHAIFRLARDTYPFPDWTQFPILEEDTPDNERRFKRYLRGVVPEAVAVIKSLQPYSRPDGLPLPEHMLWVLNKMCNIDKHRRIPVRGSVTDIFLLLPRKGVFFNRTDDGGIITLPLSAKPKVALDPKVSVDVIFGDSTEGVQIGIEGIEEIYKFVSEYVLPRLASFCK